MRRDAHLQGGLFMADDMEKNRQQGGQSGQQGGQSGQYGQKGGQTGQGGQQSGQQSGQQNPQKKGGQGQNEEDDNIGKRRAS